MNQSQKNSQQKQTSQYFTRSKTTSKDKQQQAQQQKKIVAKPSKKNYDNKRDSEDNNCDDFDIQDNNSGNTKKKALKLQEKNLKKVISIKKSIINLREKNDCQDLDINADADSDNPKASCKNIDNFEADDDGANDYVDNSDQKVNAYQKSACSKQNLYKIQAFAKPQGYNEDSDEEPTLGQSKSSCTSKSYSGKTKGEQLSLQDKEDTIGQYLKQQRQKNIEENSTDLLKCPRAQCAFRTKSEHSLKQHLRKKHSVYLMRLGIFQAACIYCKLGYEKITDCVKHEEHQCPLRPLKKKVSDKQKNIDTQFDELNCSIE